MATPILLRPIDYGADIVVHSLTKFMGGHGTTLGGAIVDSGRFPWKQHAERFPMFNEPDASYHGLVYTEHFGDAAYIARCRSVYQRTTGAVLSPLSAFLLLQGIETVALRVERHVENARRVAEFLRDDPRVDWVNYAGFADNPYHALAQKYLGGRACSLLTFGVARRARGRQDVLRRAEADQAAGQYGRRQVAGLPSGLDHAPADVGRGAAQGRRAAGDDPAQHRHRAHRRHHRRSRSGAGGGAGAARHRCSPPSSVRVREEYAMPLLLDTLRLRSARRICAAATALEIGLVNNMPDAALEATERQFVELLAPAADDIVVRLQAVLAAGRAARRRGPRATWPAAIAISPSCGTRRLDGLIVTGTEPRAPNLKDEPYWPRCASRRLGARQHRFDDLVVSRRARRRAAHRRHRAPTARRQAVRRVRLRLRDAHPPVRRARDRSCGCRIRAATICAKPTLASCGYRVLTRSAAAGVDTFARSRTTACSYSSRAIRNTRPTRLLREYRRDIGRFLRGEKSDYPSIPQGYFHRYATSLLNAFREQALGNRREDLLASFPMQSLEAALTNTWRSAAVPIYANWLSYLAAQRAIRQKSQTGMRNTLRHRPSARALAAQADHSAT